jgi:proteasome accessory factor B
MPEKITKAQRWLDLVVFLLRHRLPVSVEQIMEAIPAYAADWASEDETRRASVRRKFERDKDELRTLGIPVESVPYTVEGKDTTGYRLKDADLYMPRLVIKAGDAGEGQGDTAYRPPSTAHRSIEATPEQWATLARAAHRISKLPDSPLAPHGRSALRKLGFDLPEIAAEADAPYIHYLSVPNPEVAENLRALTPAVLDKKSVEFDYYSIYKDEHRHRSAHPYGLMYQGGNWYMIGRDPEADGIRTFRVSRMSEVKANAKSPKTPDYQVPADFRLRDYLGREAWRLGEDDADEITAEVLFLYPTSLWADRQGLGEFLREDEATGGQVRAFKVRQLDPFLRWCLSFRGQVRPLSPPVVADGLRDLARRVLALYQTDDEAH